MPFAQAAQANMNGARALKSRPVRRHAERSAPDGFRIAPVQRSDRDAVVAMLDRCSAATLYRRFHGFTDGVAHVVDVVGDAAAGNAYIAWSAESCIGLASLGFGTDDAVDVGVLIEDAWQGRGVGSALLAALAARARQQRVTALVADVLADDRHLVSLLSRLGPVTTRAVYGRYTATVALE